MLAHEAAEQYEHDFLTYLVGMEIGAFDMEDKINHPKHYNNSLAHCTCGRRLECIDVTRHMSFTIGNAVKYLWRFQDKNGVEDLRKARWYIDDAIAQLIKGEQQNDGA